MELLRTVCGPGGGFIALTWADSGTYTLKRNSTTSPSRMT